MSADDDEIATVLIGMRKNPAHEVGEKYVTRDTALDRILQRIHCGSELFPDLLLDEASEGLIAIVFSAHQDFGTQKYRQLDHVEQIYRGADSFRERCRHAERRSRVGREIGRTQDTSRKCHGRTTCKLSARITRASIAFGLPHDVA
jgi:hypothetical protein